MIGGRLFKQKYIIMEKLEIYKDHKNIAKDIEICQDAKDTIQKLYDVFAGYGCNLTSENLYEIAQNTRFGGIKEEFVTNAVKDIIINNQTGTETPKIMGLTINKERLRDLIVVPNMQEIIEILCEFNNDILNLKDLITIQSGKVEISNDYKVIIEKKHTEFAEGKTQIIRAKVLINLRDALNEYLKENILNTFYGIPEVLGLKTMDGKYEIDSYYVKNLPKQ